MRSKFSYHKIKKFTHIYYFIYTILVSLLIFACDNISDPHEILSVERLPVIDISWDSTNSIVCFGTSLTYGFVWENIFYVPTYSEISSPNHTDDPILIGSEALFYSQADSAYPHCLDRRLKLKVHNQGYVGATVDRALALVQDSVLSYNPALVLLEFSANDFLRDNDVVDVKNKMTTLIDTIQEYGSEVVLISFVDEYTLNNPPKNHVLYEKLNLAHDYYTMLHDLSTQYDILFINDCFNEIFGNTEYMCDDIHPNDLGYAKMANNISEALYNTFIHNKMYKNN
jgi:lysophospholipase L1-like esterase